MKLDITKDEGKGGGLLGLWGAGAGGEVGHASQRDSLVLLHSELSVQIEKGHTDFK